MRGATGEAGDATGEGLNCTGAIRQHKRGLLGPALETSRHAMLVTSYAGRPDLGHQHADCDLPGYRREELLQTLPQPYTRAPARSYRAFTRSSGVDTPCASM